MRAYRGKSTHLGPILGVLHQGGRDVRRGAKADDYEGGHTKVGKTVDDISCVCNVDDLLVYLKGYLFQFGCWRSLDDSPTSFSFRRKALDRASTASVVSKFGPSAP